MNGSWAGIGLRQFVAESQKRGSRSTRLFRWPISLAQPSPAPGEMEKKGGSEEAARLQRHESLPRTAINAGAYRTVPEKMERTALTSSLWGDSAHRETLPRPCAKAAALQGSTERPCVWGVEKQTGPKPQKIEINWKRVFQYPGKFAVASEHWRENPSKI